MLSLDELGWDESLGESLKEFEEQKAASYGFDWDRPQSVLAKIEEELAEFDVKTLHQRLEMVDPVSASRLHVNLEEENYIVAVEVSDREGCAEHIAGFALVGEIPLSLLPRLIAIAIEPDDRAIVFGKLARPGAEHVVVGENHAGDSQFFQNRETGGLDALART